MYSNPYDYGNGDAAGAIAGAFACAAFITLVIVVLYLWLFYRIFTKAGYSGWYTLLNLIPYVGSVIVVFMLAFGDWPIFRQQSPPSYGAPGGYPPAGGGYVPPVAPGGYSQPMPPAPAEPARPQPIPPAPSEPAPPEPMPPASTEEPPGPPVPPA